MQKFSEEVRKLREKYGRVDYSLPDDEQLVGLDWKRANLYEMNLEGAILNGANLRGAYLSKAKVRGADLCNTNLEGAILKGANLEETHLARANLAMAHLEGANLENANLRWAILTEAFLRKANLRAVELWEANVSKADLRGANLQGANLYEANVQGAKLQNARLEGANLTKANLQGTNLCEANLQCTRGENAHLEEANLFGAHLKEARLEEANLREASLLGAKLTEANLQNTELVDANFEYADLYGARFEESNLHRSLLPGTDVREIKKTEIETLTKNMKAKQLAESTIHEITSHISDILTHENRYRECTDIYREIKNVLHQNGAYDEESHYHFMERRAHTKSLWKESKSVADRFFWYPLNQFFRALCGYGERPLRLILWVIATILFFGTTFWAFNGVVPQGTAALQPIDYYYFSIVTFTTLGFGDLYPSNVHGALDVPWFRVAAMSEALIGAFLMALFVVVAAKRMSR